MANNADIDHLQNGVEEMTIWANDLSWRTAVFKISFVKAKELTV